jgi:hypothetical protein
MNCSDAGTLVRVAVLTDNRCRADHRKPLWTLGTLSFGYLGDEFGWRAEHRTSAQLGQKVLLQAHPGGSCSGLIYAMHGIRDIPDLNCRHGAILAL